MRLSHVKYRASTPKSLKNNYQKRQVANNENNGEVIADYESVSGKGGSITVNKTASYMNALPKARTSATQTHSLDARTMDLQF